MNLDSLFHKYAAGEISTEETLARVMIILRQVAVQTVQNNHDIADMEKQNSEIPQIQRGK